ncbi:flagellar basal body P-ring formation chaperone FlgA [Planctomicrobium sp. SH664]|uniref:flagellar basal body P-ring formation chaperone FlgA n=1 Tax=Planctomicrobium sp. SH664 TaxID=3448125 RepID=UPI003F5B767C
MIRRAMLWSLLCGLLPTALQSGESQPGAPTCAVVQLQPGSRAGGSHVRLGDVAEIVDQNPNRKLRLQEIDLADLRGDEDLLLTRSRVEVRLLLAGYAPDEVTVTGPERILVRPLKPVELTDLGIEQAVFQQLCEQYQVSPSDLHVKLVNPFLGSWLDHQLPLSQPSIELVPTPQLPLGRTQLTVRLRDGNRVVAARSAVFEIGRRQQVVVALASLDRSHVVTVEHLREEVRYVDSPMDQLSVDRITGRKVLVPLKPGEVVTLRHLSAEAAPEAEVLIKQGDAVRLIARKGVLTVVVPTAVALQAGREGQAIRVRNTESNRVVTGRVIARGEVEVPLY